MWVALFELFHTSLGLHIPLVSRSRNQNNPHQHESSSKELPVDNLASLMIIQIYQSSFPMLCYELALNLRQAPARFALVYCPSDGTDCPIQRLL